MPLPSNFLYKDSYYWGPDGSGPYAMTSAGDMQLIAGVITTYTAAQLSALAAAGGLTAGTTYRASDTGDDYDAMSSSVLRLRSYGNQTNHRRFVFVGDSITQGNTQRAVGFFDGRCWWTTAATLTNLGAGAWVVQVMIDGRAASGAAGTLQTDGAGRLQFKLTGDTNYGPYVDVTAGGWYLLNSGESPYQCWVSVRGATTPPSAGTGALTTSGIPLIQEHTPHAFTWWAAGAFGDTFTDYQPYGISGAKMDDIVKLLPQVTSSPMEAACVLIGTNDVPSNAAAAQAVIDKTKVIVNALLAVANRVYLGEIFPSTNYTATQQKFLQLASNALRVWSKTVPRVRFWSATQYLMSKTALATQRTGAFFDGLHLQPYGGYLAAIDLVRAVRQDYPDLDIPRFSYQEAYDSTLGVGCWNTNPSLRGTGGSGSGSNGWTGTVPDGWSATRSGGAQTAVGSFVDDPAGGLSWYTVSVAGNTASEYSEINQTVSVPAGINVGDYFSLSVEVRIGAMGGGGLKMFVVQANGNASAQNDYVFQVTTSRPIDLFSTELPILRVQSEPQILLAGTTSFVIRVRVAATVSTGTGVVGFRKIEINKVAGPAALVA